jgi:hypothetical protein
MRPHRKTSQPSRNLSSFICSSVPLLIAIKMRFGPGYPVTYPVSATRGEMLDAVFRAGLHKAGDYTLAAEFAFIR